MKDSIHKRLTDHIRKTVGRHELPYEPGSWEEFQRLQRKRRQRQPLIGFRYAMAACLILVVLGAPIWFYLNQTDAPKMAAQQPKGGFLAKKANQSSKENRRSEPGLPNPTAVLQPNEKPVNPAQQELAQTGTEWKKSLPHPMESESPVFKYPHPITFKRVSPQIEKTAGIDFVQKPDAAASAENRFVDLTSTAVPTSYETIPARSRTIYRWSRPALGLPLTAGSENRALAKIERSTLSQKPVLGISLAPQSVYATGSSPAMAVGGGLYSEIPLSKRFSLSTGLSLARQSVGTKEPEIFSVSTVPQRVSTDIRLLAVDLPLNLRFRPVKNTKTGFYVEAGLSSLAFLNEHYADTYAQMKPVTILVMGSNGQEQAVTQYVTSREIVNRSEPAFQHIYWGRIMNISVGIERRINARFRLSAEPYLKYPLGPFTRENLLLGSGGVSLRLGLQAGR